MVPGSSLDCTRNVRWYVRTLWVERTWYILLETGAVQRQVLTYARSFFSPLLYHILLYSTMLLYNIITQYRIFLLVHSFIYLFCLLIYYFYLFIYSFIYSFIYLFIYLFREERDYRASRESDTNHRKKGGGSLYLNGTYVRYSTKVSQTSYVTTSTHNSTSCDLISLPFLIFPFFLHSFLYFFYFFYFFIFFILFFLFLLYGNSR